VSKHKTKLELLRQIDRLNEQLQQSRKLQEDYQAYTGQLKHEVDHHLQQKRDDGVLQGIIIALTVALGHLTKMEHGERSIEYAMEMTAVAQRAMFIAKRKLYHPLDKEEKDAKDE